MPTSIRIAASVDAVQAPDVGAPAFTPNALPNPAGWFNAGDGSTLFLESSGTPPGTTPAGDGQTCGTHRDKSGLGRHSTQSLGTSRPTRNAIVSPSVLVTDGTDRLFSATFAALPQPFTFCVVSDNLANNSMWFDHGTGATRVLAQRGANNAQVTIFAGVLLTVATPLPVDVRRAYLFEYNGANSKVWQFDGTTFVQCGATGNAGTNQLADFRWFGSSSGFLVANEYSEAFAFGAATTAQIRTDIAGYVKPQWGL